MKFLIHDLLGSEAPDYFNTYRQERTRSWRKHGERMSREGYYTSGEIQSCSVVQHVEGPTYTNSCPIQRRWGRSPAETMGHDFKPPTYEPSIIRSPRWSNSLINVRERISCLHFFLGGTAASVIFLLAGSDSSVIELCHG